jgi:hypothetical protein
MTTPNPAVQYSQFFGVSCTSPTFCVAAGWSTDTSGFSGPYETLAEEWDGSTWSTMTTTNPSTDSNQFLGVSCTSTTFCVASGADGATLAEECAPTGVDVLPLDAGAQVFFGPPTSNGGSAVTSCTVTAADAANPGRGGQSATGTASPITVTGLTNGDTYTFSVTASNPAGPGPSSNPSGNVIPAVQSALRVGQYLSANEMLSSPNGHYYATVMQSDENVVTWGPSGAIWSTKTYGNPGAALYLQTDGNVVLWSGGNPLWSSGTSGLGGTELVMQNDGNLVLWGPSGPVSSSLYGYAPTTLLPGNSITPNTYLISPNGQYHLVLQHGDVVVYGPSNIYFDTGTYGTSGDALTLQSDGNLVLWGTTGAIWSTGTYGSGVYVLAMQNDGNLVLWGPSGAVWSYRFGRA